MGILEQPRYLNGDSTAAAFAEGSLRLAEARWFPVTEWGDWDAELVDSEHVKVWAH